MPFTFSPVALYVECSLLFCRLRFLTFWLFLWRGFFDVVGFSSKNVVSLSLRLSSVIVSFANLKPVKRVVRHVFLLANLRLEASFQFGSCPFGFSVLIHKFPAIFQYLGVCQRLHG